jgi:hypothetical protein
MANAQDEAPPPFNIKTLVKEYYTAYTHSQRLPELKVQLMQAMKRENITGKAFEIGSAKIAYKTYEEKEGLSQKFIKSTLRKHYPDMDADEFLRVLCAERGTKSLETIRVTPVKPVKPVKQG